MLYASTTYKTPAFKDMSDHQREVFEANWPGVALVMRERRKTYANDPEKINEVSTWYYSSRQRITMAEAHAIQTAGIDISLEAIDGTMLQPQKDNGERLDRYGDVHSLDLHSGAVVQIVVPDVGVLQINEVDYIEDACTDALQGKLDDGWRILAVCPPNAQRRPDYILGRRRAQP